MASTNGPGDSDRIVPLLGRDDLPPVGIINPDARSSFLLIGDHAGNRIPAMLGDMGLDAADRVRHIAWDIGVGALGERLSAMLDATFVRQVYSRLVVDCNRTPGAADAMPAVSDGTAVPANAALGAAARDARVAAIHAPYQAAIARTIAGRDARGQGTILVSLHSFTPTMAGAARPWEIGILHDEGDARFALACLEWLHRESGRTIGDNEPYRMDLIDHTVPNHAYPEWRPYVEIEVRQDLMGDDAGVATIAAVLAAMLTAAVARYEGGTGTTLL